MHKTIKYIRSSLLVFIYYIWVPVLKLVPRSTNIHIFGAWHGTRYEDNTRYFYEFLLMKKNISGKKIIWITKNKSLCKKIKNCYYKNSYKGIYYRLRAKYYYLTNSIDDIGYIFSLGAVKIQLWHGMPIKRIEYDDTYRYFLSPKNTNEYIKALILKIIKPSLYVKYDYLFVTSKFYKKIFTSAFRTSSENIFITGSPRDSFIKQGARCSITNKSILYAPTFRENDFDYTSSIINKNFNNFLRKNNFNLFIKLHPNDEKKHIYLETYSNIFFIGKEESIQKYMKFVDVLITDYSSLFIDFLLLEKMIVFYAFDINEYTKNDRKLYIRYDENNLPGKIVFNLSELKNILKAYLTNQYTPVNFKNKKIYHEYNDWSSMDRIYSVLKDKNVF